MDDKDIKDHNNKVKQLQKYIKSLFPTGCNGIICDDCILQDGNTDIDESCCKLISNCGCER